MVVLLFGANEILEISKPLLLAEVIEKLDLKNLALDFFAKKCTHRGR